MCCPGPQTLLLPAACAKFKIRRCIPVKINFPGKCKHNYAKWVGFWEFWRRLNQNKTKNFRFLYYINVYFAAISMKSVIWDVVDKHVNNKSKTNIIVIHVLRRHSRGNDICNSLTSTAIRTGHIFWKAEPHVQLISSPLFGGTRWRCIPAVCIWRHQPHNIVLADTCGL